MSLSWKYILGDMAPNGACSFGSVSEWVSAWFLIVLQHLLYYIIQDGLDKFDHIKSQML